MREQPLVSIITGYYNRQHLVDESIQSLINQTYENIEIIIFDDCSTDNTYQELKKFEEFPKVKLIRHERNIGFVKGLINAISNAKGEYIAIHGSGDISYPERIEKQVNVLLNNENVSTVGCYIENYLNGEKLSTMKWDKRGEYYNAIIQGNLFSHGEVMFKKNFYDLVGGYRKEFKYAQDRDLWCRLSLESEYLRIKEVLYKRRNDSNNAIYLDPHKRIKQAIYSEFAVQSIEMRKKIGYDYIDILEHEGISMLKFNNKLLKRIFKIIFKQTVYGNEIFLDKYYPIFYLNKLNKYSSLIFLVRIGIINKKSLKLIKTIKNFIT